ncbi:RNA polymerase II transcription initiation factor TFIIA, large chain [Phaffia rhodozyma]|uniref:RNA polymerase II transcription initiation factor TFIIA, large chain n=1 Tax=Phaffia rhodozyma TaxID=264483 RepID=A0A0F7SI30_PHARH|nr:RNA polymerase II transcription initiation factor TFIIA, large chain [Phaffia rhodozyma]
MSNRIVPNIYRIIIDDVVQSVRADFDEFGVEEDMLALLQQKWESKLLESHVADFEPAPPTPLPSEHSPSSTSYPYSSLSGLPIKKDEWQGSLKGGGDDAMRLRGGEDDDEDEDSDDRSASSSSAGDLQSDTEEPPQRTSVVTPAVPLSPAVPVPYEANAQGIYPGDEEINSELDDSDDEADEVGKDADTGALEGMDIVFCVYDKVQRVKNKWKMIFKDGMAHVNGKDYLFAKASSDFEW